MSHLFYKSRMHSAGALTSHVVVPDGRLKTMGTTRLCVATEAFFVRPLAAVRGFVSGDRAFDGSGMNTVCTWKGPRLAPQANLGFTTEAAAVSSPTEPAPALLATASEVHTRRYVYLRTDLRLLSVGSDGGVALLARVELPNRVRQLLFDPSGRFLFVADEQGRVASYAVAGGTGLEPAAELPAAVGLAYRTSIMAVSAHPAAPQL